jgi:DNA mismatch endonuclease, patch repair protein
MSRIRGKNTKPELMVRGFLHGNGFRFRLNDAKLPGKPDIVLVRHRTAIFVNGCFWHGHAGCRYFVVPGTRTRWWLNKISSNRKNDSVKRRALRKLGWHVITVWECQLRPEKREQALAKLLSNIR